MLNCLEYNHETLYEPVPIEKLAKSMNKPIKTVKRIYSSALRKIGFEAIKKATEVPEIKNYREYVFLRAMAEMKHKLYMDELWEKMDALRNRCRHTHFRNVEYIKLEDWGEHEWDQCSQCGVEP